MWKVVLDKVHDYPKMQFIVWGAASVIPRSMICEQWFSRQSMMEKHHADQAVEITAQDAFLYHNRRLRGKRK